MAVAGTDRSAKHVVGLRTGKQKYDDLVRYVVLVSLFSAKSTISKAISWVKREPLPKDLHDLAKKSGPGLKYMERLWKEAVRDAPTGILRSEFYLLEMLAEAKYEAKRLGNVVPPAEGDPSPGVWQRARDFWARRESDARKGLAKIDVAPLETLLPSAAQPDEPAGRLSEKELDDLVG